VLRINSVEGSKTCGEPFDDAQDKLCRTIQNLKWVVLLVALLRATTVLSAEGQKWQTEWERSLAAARKEGQLVLYGSADFEM
jgi:hypothetical protein